MNNQFESETKPNREPREHRLFHYTRKPEHLKDMLRNGLWPRFCAEHFGWLLGKELFIAFPALCFCDIPLDATATHRDRYGSYAIGFSKDLAAQFDITPLWYVQEGTSLAKHLAGALKSGVRFDLNADGVAPIRPLLPFLKPTIGFQLDRTATKRKTDEIFGCDEEMEWRHTPAALHHTWAVSDDREFVTEMLHELSKGHRMKIPLESIECVFVADKPAVEDLLKEFPPLTGKVFAWEGAGKAMIE